MAENVYDPIDDDIMKQLYIENARIRGLIGMYEQLAAGLMETFRKLQATKLSDEQQDIFGEYVQAYAQIVLEGVTDGEEDTSIEPS